MELAEALFAGLISLPLLRTWLVVGAALTHAARHRRYPRPPEAPPGGVSVLIPAHNEEDCIVDTVRSALAAIRQIPDAEIIVVDDGSVDGTWERLRALDGEPGLTMHRQAPNRGKAQALNLALDHARGRWCVTLDADTRLDPEAIARILGPARDLRVVAIAGNVKVANRGGVLGAWQSIEYVGALNLDRRAQALFQAISTVPGAFGAWRVDVLRHLRGFSGRTLAEDTDATLAVALAGGRVSFAPDAIAWTQAPHSWSGLFRQRVRWLRGNLQCLGIHGGRWPRAPLPFVLFGLPDFAWRHLGAIVALPLSIALLPPIYSAGDATAYAGAVGLVVAVDVGLVALAHALDSERARLAHLIAQRVIWPWFTTAVLARVIALAIGRSPAAWGPSERLSTRPPHR